MTVNSKSISKAGGTAIYRGVVYIGPNAKGTKGSISCESLMLDNESRSDTIPDIVIEMMILTWDTKPKSDAFRTKIFTTL